jgi:hypothetical protein
MRMYPLLWALVVALATVLSPSLRPAAATAAAADEAPKLLPPNNVGGIPNASGTATVSGVVRFKGTKPAPKPITDIAGNAFCKNCYKDGELPKEDTYVFGKNVDDDTLQNVLVYVSKGLEGKQFDPPKEPVVLDQVGCVYTPHVVAVMTGQTLEIRNSDETLHNVMTQPRNNAPFNIGMPVKDQKLNKVFKQPEMKMNLRCFMHPWMSAYVHVLPNPFFAITGPDGTFTIKGLPPGEYELTVLHEATLFEPTPATTTVKVAAGESAKADFTYHAREKKD